MFWSCFEKNANHYYMAYDGSIHAFMFNQVFVQFSKEDEMPTVHAVVTIANVGCKEFSCGIDDNFPFNFYLSPEDVLSGKKVHTYIKSHCIEIIETSSASFIQYYKSPYAKGVIKFLGYYWDENQCRVVCVKVGTNYGMDCKVDLLNNTIIEGTYPTSNVVYYSSKEQCQKNHIPKVFEFTPHEKANAEEEARLMEQFTEQSIALIEMGKKVGFSVTFRHFK